MATHAFFLTCEEICDNCKAQYECSVIQSLLMIVHFSSSSLNFAYSKAKHPTAYQTGNQTGWLVGV